jgi:hypothetical protein
MAAQKEQESLERVTDFVEDKEVDSGATQSALSALGGGAAAAQPEKSM